jgi:hypothetical protein
MGVVKTTGYGIDPVGRKVISSDARTNRYRKAMALKEELGLTDDERHELAQMLPRVDKDDGGSWKELDSDQLHDLITMMEGYIFITHMLMERE